MALVIGLIVWARLHPFLALIIGATSVAVVTPALPLGDAAAAVATEFGAVCGRIGIIIALASFIGIGLQRSGGASRIGAAFLALAGPRRAHLAMWGSGYVLSVPVFFDTVFYLLVPLARAMHARSRSGYTRYLMGIMAGGCATHVFVPPTPGPLAAGAALGVDLGLMIIIGAVVALTGSLGGLAYATWAFNRWPAAARGTIEQIEEAEPAAAEAGAMPGLLPSLVPIVLPVLLIAGRTIANALKLTGGPAAVVAFIGDPNVALFLAAAVTMWLLARWQGVTRHEMAQIAEDAFASAGVIILITAAGGAYGAMLTKAQVGSSLAATAADAGLPLLWMAFMLASLLKFAQGSSTVAIITTASILQSTYAAGTPGLPHPVYAALAASGGSLVGTWMNDSGFWVICKMSGMTESEALRSVTPMGIVMGFTGLAATLIGATFFPLV